jgi:hypothetical protein
MKPVDQLLRAFLDERERKALDKYRVYLRDPASAKLIWLFHARGARFAGGAFQDVAIAEYWIAKHKLTGVLTAYPLDEGCFDWALRSGGTGMKEEKLKEKSSDPAFIGGFTSAAQTHIHFENGKRAQQG